ncbi:hypothetical protein B0H10DRAFT_2392137 [Mycena sp. CBHHK59/15]|nr:hypothetical protein B0H10DRAFT_2392137 [Mycena sp. CBHHK59/15]
MLPVWRPSTPDYIVSLGIRGVKAEKRRIVQRQLRAQLEVYRPRPPLTAQFPPDHLGHCLGGMIMNTGGKSRNDLVAGSWVQPCRGCNQPRCKGRVFVVTGPLSPDILNLPELQKLFEACAELYATGNSTGITPLSPSSTPTPAPPSPMPTPTLTPIPREPSHSSPPAQEAEHSATPATPAHRTLHFDYGGYGGLHYSPDGHIVAPSSNSTTLINDSDSDDDIPDLQSLGGITWDLRAPPPLCSMHVMIQPDRLVFICIVTLRNHKQIRCKICIPE